MTLVDIVMLGRTNYESLAVAALGGTVFNMLWYFIEGFLTAQDTLSSQLSGEMRHWMYVSISITLVLCFFGTVVLALTPVITTYIFMTDSDISMKVSSYVAILIPSLWFLGLYRVLQKYFLSTGSTRPSTACALVANVVNLLGNLLLIDALGLAEIGCAISTCFARLTLAIGLIWSLQRTGQFRMILPELLELFAQNAWTARLATLLPKSQQSIVQAAPGDESNVLELVQIRPPAPTTDKVDDDAEAENWSDMDDRDQQELPYETATTSSGLTSLPSQRDFLSSCVTFIWLGCPSAVVMCVEMWTYEITTVVVSHMGSSVLAAHHSAHVLSNLAFLSGPFALSIAVCSRVGALLAVGKAAEARKSSTLAIFLAVIISVGWACLLFETKDIFGFLFLADESTVTRLSALAIPISLFMMVDAVQGVCQGVMRGTGRQMQLLGLQVICVWGGGVPLGIYLGFYARPTFGLTGLWYGLTIGTGMLAISLLGLILTNDWVSDSADLRLAIHRSGGIGGSGGGADVLPPVSGAGRAIGGFMPLLDDENEEDNSDDSVQG